MLQANSLQRGTLPRLELAHAPAHQYHLVFYAEDRGYWLEPRTYRWDSPTNWDAVLKQMATDSQQPNFSCWLDSEAGDRFLAEQHFAPIQTDGVMEPFPPIFSRFGV